MSIVHDAEGDPRPRRANVAYARQSQPDSGLGFQAKALEPMFAVPLRSEAA